MKATYNHYSCLEGVSSWIAQIVNICASKCTRLPNLRYVIQPNPARRRVLTYAMLWVELTVCCLNANQAHGDQFDDSNAYLHCLRLHIRKKRFEVFREEDVSVIES